MDKDIAAKGGREGFSQQELQHLLIDFSTIYKIRDLVEREYRLVQQAKEFDGSLEEYRRLFEIYAEVQKQAHWTSHFKRFVQVIQAFGFIAVVVTAVKFSWDTADRHRKHLFENWDIVALNNIDPSGKPISVSRGRKEALEYLHDRGEDLSRLKAKQAVLSGLNLPGKAQLQDADFQGAALFSAYLSGANLYNVDFRSVDLNRANLRDTDLRFAHFQGADLQNACLRSANLEGADFEGSNLDKVDFRGARGLDVAKIKKGNNYKTALYDEELSSQFESPFQKASDDASEGCQISPRLKNWWDDLFK